MAKLVPAERGWHVVTVDREQFDQLRIYDIQRVTHFSVAKGDMRGDRPMQDGKQLHIDPDDNRHCSSCRYLMDPKGRLLGWGGKLVANSVFDLNEAYAKWRNSTARERAESR